MFDSTRRGFLKGTAGTAATLVAAGLAASPKAYADDDEIVIASIFDQSGGLDIYGTPMTQTCELAVEEINAAGGLLGKKVRLIKYDPQSNMELYAQYAQEAALKERVDLVHGAITSASREVIRPILRRFQTLLWYSVIYEGGVCDINNFVSGVTAVQWVKPMADYGFKTHGKRCYYIGADYNAPQIIGKWTEVFAKEQSSEVITKDFFPLDVAEFGPAIAKIQEAKPDWLSTCLVGAAHTGFYRQWYAAGMLNEIPIVSVTFGVGNEHVQLSAEEGNGIVSAQPYFQELQLPANVEFVKRYQERFGDDAQYLNSVGIGGYLGTMLWSLGVKAAGSHEREAVIEALRSGDIAWDGPAGHMVVDPVTNHVIQDMHMAECQNQTWNIFESYSQLYPSDVIDRCDLTKDPDMNAHLEPII